MAKLWLTLGKEGQEQKGRISIKESSTLTEHKEYNGIYYMVLFFFFGGHSSLATHIYFLL